MWFKGKIGWGLLMMDAPRILVQKGEMTKDDENEEELRERERKER